MGTHLFLLLPHPVTSKYSFHSFLSHLLTTHLIVLVFTLPSLTWFPAHLSLSCRKVNCACGHRCRGSKEPYTSEMHVWGGRWSAENEPWSLITSPCFVCGDEGQRDRGSDLAVSLFIWYTQSQGILSSSIFFSSTLPSSEGSLNVRVKKWITVSWPKPSNQTWCQSLPRLSP